MGGLIKVTSFKKGNQYAVPVEDILFVVMKPVGSLLCLEKERRGYVGDWVSQPIIYFQHKLCGHTFFKFRFSNGDVGIVRRDEIEQIVRESDGGVSLIVKGIRGGYRLWGNFDFYQQQEEGKEQKVEFRDELINDGQDSADSRKPQGHDLLEECPIMHLLCGIMAIDGRGNRWAKCVKCGYEGLASGFAQYGGPGVTVNDGVCLACAYPQYFENRADKIVRKGN